MHRHGASAGDTAVNELTSVKPAGADPAGDGPDYTGGPITVDRYSLTAARAINALLTGPIAVLPQKEGDIIRPFRVGIGEDIRMLLRPEIELKDLRKALRRYAYSAQYLQALSQDGSMRHEINGEAVQPVSEEDRVQARQAYLTVSARRLGRR